MLRGELNGNAGSPEPSEAPAQATESDRGSPEPEEDGARIQTRIRAAKNIFDAEEVAPAPDLSESRESTID
jgi:hypothetical protein